MPKYYVSRYLTTEASTVYEVFADGTYRSVSPQGSEHSGSGDLPVDLELDAGEALRMIEARLAWLAQQEKEGLPPAPGPLVFPFEGLLQDGVVTDEKRADAAWKKDGWGHSEGP